MSTIIPQPKGSSPFDHLMQVDEDGREYWSARDLQAPSGYDRWETFTSSIERAIAACENSGANPKNHFRGAAKKVRIGSAASRSLIDWHLTRYASYLVAMNGDPRKPEIAAAQTYFAAKTREAEAAQASPVSMLPDITTPAGVLAMAEQFALTARQLVDADARIAELEPKALMHDTFLTAQDGDVLVRQAAKALHMKEKQLRQFLADEHLLYRRKATCGADQWDFYAEHDRHFNAVEKVVEHTWGKCAHYTVYVTPAGLALVQKRIAKRKAELAAAIQNS